VKIKEKLRELDAKARQSTHKNDNQFELEGDILLPAALAPDHSPVLLSRNHLPFLRMAGGLGAHDSLLNMTATYKFHQNRLLG
jgi:hypothetical protein